MKLGFENKTKMGWAVGLGVLGIALLGWQIAPFFAGPSTEASSASAVAPVAPRAQTRGGGKASKVPKPDNLDPTLQLDLLASSEKREYEGNGRNIFVSQAEDVVIPKAVAPGQTDTGQPGQPAAWTPAPVQQAPPIPLKFYGFASSPGEPKRVFLKLNEDVFVAGEGEIVDRRYKVVRISANSVEIQDVVNSGPPQSIPLTQG